MTTPSTTASAPPTQMSHRQIMVVLSALGLGMLLAALDQTIVATALPTIVGEFGGISHLSWVVTAYMLTSTASTPLYGKISDLYGRKRIFQAAIVIFLVGSALSGLAQNMNELIAYRAIQGLGAGGLMTLAMTIIADVIPPRQRGRYQGFFGGVFAMASVGGPLLGGFFVDHLTWRWVFYINIPLGALALMVTSVVLKVPVQRREHDIDYLGAATLVAGISALLLVTVWGGSEFAWTSPEIIGLALAGLVLVAVFLWWEQRVTEPILPPSLFRDRTFNVSSALMFVISLTLFGAMIFLPVYLQLVHGASATASGLLLTPMMAGVLVASIGSGRLVTKLGRYRIFPIIGTAVMTIGMWMLTHLHASTSYVVFGVMITVLGAGMGFCMQNVLLAVQNSANPRDVGTATSGVSMFRSMGGAFGTALFGAILANRLTYWLGALAPSGAAKPRMSGTALIGSPAKVHELPVAIQTYVQDAFVHALHAVFLIGTPIAALGILFALLLPEVRLRDRPAFGQADDATPDEAYEAVGAGAVID